MNKLKQLMMAMALAAASAHAGVIFTLDPLDGQVFGSKGVPAVWGYTLSNTDPDTYVKITNIFFIEGSPIGNFSTPGIPGFAAWLGHDIAVTGIVNLQGLQYDVTGAHRVGDASAGPMWLLYDTYSDPGLAADTRTSSGSLVVATDAGGLDVTAQVTVNVASVPEPATLSLVGGVLVLAGMRWRKARR